MNMSNGAYIKLQTDTEAVLLALLPLLLRVLSFTSIAFDSHHGFIGKKRLKEAILERLPLGQLAEVGFGKPQISLLMNKLLKQGLTSELIAEAKDRKSRAFGIASGGRFFDDKMLITPPRQARNGDDLRSSRLSAKRGERLSYPMTPTTMPDSRYCSLLTPMDSYALSSLISDKFGSGIVVGMDRSCNSLTSGISREEMCSNILPPSISTSPELGSNFPNSASIHTMSPLPEAAAQKHDLPFALQHQLFTYLQWSLESACYVFVKANLPDIFDRNPKLAICPQAAELTDWNKVIIMAAPRLNIPHGNVQSFQDAIKTTDSIRHDAVHRNMWDAEKVMGRVRATVNVVSLLKNLDSGTRETSSELECHHSSLCTVEHALKDVLDSDAADRGLMTSCLWKQLKELTRRMDPYFGKIADPDEELRRNILEKEKELSTSFDLGIYCKMTSNTAASSFTLPKVVPTIVSLG